LWILWWLTTSAQEEVVRDSDEFTAALKIWHPFIYEQLGTPRALKRFKNRIRFMAHSHIVLRESALVAIAAIRLRYATVNEGRDADSTVKNALTMHEAKFGLITLLEQAAVLDSATFN
jgi:hypothetical protein